MIATTTTLLQLALGLGLINVWLLRSNLATPYRGRNAMTLREEFSAYGLPTWVFYLVGSLKLSAAALLIAGLWAPAVVRPAAMLVVVLMLGAISMHVRVKDTPLKSAPAALMLAMSAGLCALTIG